MVETLNELSLLRASGFGQPRPRHGLKLLYWFANDCISFDNNNEMHSECDPADGDFGFHHFENRYNENYVKILPDVNTPYYVVGNLNSRGADQLPSYVSEDYSTYHDNRNTDRIIISLDNDEWIERVYITRHIDNSNYDPGATFRITRGLLKIIRRMDLEKFESTIRIRNPIPPAFSTSHVAVEFSDNLAPELHDNVEKEHPPIPKSTNTTIIQMEDTPREEKLENKAVWWWSNCAIL